MSKKKTTSTSKAKEKDPVLNEQTNIQDMLTDIEDIATRCKKSAQESTTAANLRHAQELAVKYADTKDRQEKDYCIALLKIELQRAQDAEEQL